MNDNLDRQVMLLSIFQYLTIYPLQEILSWPKSKRNDTELRLELEKNNLYTDVENACLNYNRGKDEFAAANANFILTQNPLKP